MKVNQFIVNKYACVCLIHILFHLDAVRRNPPTCRGTDAEVAFAIKASLRFAKDRDGGRRRGNVSLE